jgi:hypothetical protein
MVDRGDETREGCNAMRLSEEDADDAEVTFGDGDFGFYADGAAERFV